nr:hypothetical protein GCM10020241_11750 [Streptoalloteichus tenebrarius]
MILPVVMAATAGALPAPTVDPPTQTDRPYRSSAVSAHPTSFTDSPIYAASKNVRT